MPRIFPPAVWERIERLYREGELSVAEIGRLTGVAYQTINDRARRKGWPTRAEIIARGPQSAGARLRRLLEKRLDRLEKRMSDTDTRAETQADSERLTREMGALGRAYERLEALAPRPAAEAGQHRAGNAPTSATEAGEAERDAEHWRRELAQRIARLRERWPA